MKERANQVNYKIIISNKAKKKLRSIPSPYFDKIIESINNLSVTPKPFGSIKLTNRTAYRIKIGDYRVIYEIDYTIKIVAIITISHRKEAYKLH